MEKKFTKVISMMLAMVAGFSTVGTNFAEMTTVLAEESSVINQSTVWSYLDTGKDPVEDTTVERTSWTSASYDTTDWKSATGSFGAKGGELRTIGDYTPNTLLTQYKEDGTTDIEAYFFRTTINVEDPSTIKAITGNVVYSDSAAVTVYVNGNKVVGFNDSNITSNMQYVNTSTNQQGGAPSKGPGGGPQQGGPQQKESGPSTGSISINENIENILVKGENVIAVEVHQSSSSSSNIYFDMPSLTLSSESIPVDITDISLTVGSDETKRNFTWYSNYSNGGTLLVAKNSDVQNGVMPEGATVLTPTVKQSSTKTGYYSCQTTVTDLESSTTYAYQIVDGSTKTEVKTFTTGTGSAFSFAFAGDPQIGASRNDASDGEGWDETLSLINTTQELSGVEFLLSAGDQVEKATNEEQYSYYLNHSTLLDLPVATNVGNHDSSSVAYDEHFNVPNETAYGTTEASGDYYFVYNHVLFMALNSNNKSTAEHKQFMEEAIEATKDQNITWKVVTFHHSIYSVASHASDEDIIERRTQLSPVFKELDIDVVLMGHDHVYCRTYMMDGETPMTDASIYDDENYSSITNPEGILYVTANSASGSKYYNIKEGAEYEYSAVMDQSKKRNISRVDISDDQFTITTYTLSDTNEMSVLDTFTIYHKQAYTITTDTAEHGTVTSDVTSAYEGETVSLTATPEDGYRFVGWTVVSGNATIENNSFTMPAGDVEVKAEFELIASTEDKKDTTNTTQNTSTSTSEQPKTGVNSNIVLFASAMIIASVGALVAFLLRKKA